MTLPSCVTIRPPREKDPTDPFRKDAERCFCGVFVAHDGVSGTTHQRQRVNSSTGGTFQFSPQTEMKPSRTQRVPDAAIFDNCNMIMVTAVGEQLSNENMLVFLRRTQNTLPTLCR